MNKLLITSMVLPFLCAGTLVHAQEPGQGHWMGPWMMNWGFGMWWFMPFIMIAFWILVIAGMIFSSEAHGLHQREGDAIRGNTTGYPENEIRQGEINGEEFERKKKDIS